MPRIDVRLDEIPLGTLFRVECDGSPIVLIRTSGGVSAFFDRCPHAHWPLSEGKLQDGLLQCVGHGWQFDVRTGECLTVSEKISAYEVVIEDGFVKILI